MTCRSILIVEDEPDIRETLEELLRTEGYLVVTAENGSEGLERLREIPKPCLILLDMLMPVMTGMEFLEVKGRDDLLATIPVCVVSGVPDRPKLPGMVAYVKKPIEFDGLLKWVKRFCGDPQMARDSESNRRE